MARNPRGGEAVERGNNSASSPRSKNDSVGEDFLLWPGGGAGLGKITDESAEIKTIEYTNGNVYEGELQDGNRHGKGVYRYADGAVYEGEWQDDEKRGRGTLTLANGDSYEGQFVSGKAHGKGTLKESNGSGYDGEWKDGLKHGKGKQWGSDGSAYEGGYKDDVRHGKGTFRWKEGDIYEGEFKDDVQHGNGTMNYSSGDVYVGEWAKGVEHGKGTLSYSSGNIYEGVWTNGKMTQGKKTAGRDERKGAPNTTSCELPERKLRSQRSQQRRLQKKAATKLCEQCGADDGQYKLRACSGCNLALYCSAACQKAASGSHRRICDIVPELPPRDAETLALEYDKDKLVDLDAGLRYAKKYMGNGNMKHLIINLEAMSKGDTSVKLSAKQLTSLLRSKRGALDSVFWLSNDYIQARGHDVGRRVVEHGSIWKELHGLKQLRLEFVGFDDVQSICDIISQQKNTLTVLWLPYLGIDWSKAKCRRTIALAVSCCKNLVKLDLQGSVLMDSDLKIMLQDLPNLRILNLRRSPDYSHEFTDNTCGLIARKCPGLQKLNLHFHNYLSVRGIRKIFEGCVHLRSFFTTTRKLTCKDVVSLLEIAPQLLYLSLGAEAGISKDELSNIIEATGGRTVLRLSNDCVFEPDEVSAETKENYESQTDVLRSIWSRRNDPEVANECAGMLEG